MIAAGLSSGERVVTSGFAQLTDGSRVAVASSDAADEGANARPRGRALPGADESPPARRERRQPGAVQAESPSATAAGPDERPTARAAAKRREGEPKRRGLPGHERLGALHHPADRDFALGDCGDAGRRARLLDAAVASLPQFDFPLCK